ncbi:MAG: arginine--tRNA ligase [Candidatus Poseidoniales archaeon]|jgi:arginyl-tRNA synthetase
MELLRKVLEPHLGEVLAAAGLDNLPWQKMLTIARESAQGDLTLPCFPFAKILKQPPAQVAKNLCEAVQLRKSQDTDFNEVLLSVEAINGYLNFISNPAWIAKQILSQYDENSGKAADKDHRVLIEHTSANPNGPFHVGRARNAILGDTLVRLHRLHGHEVQAQYYVDDMGKQVGILAWALKNLDAEKVSEVLASAGRQDDIGPWQGKQDHERVRWYQAANIVKENNPLVDEEVGEMVRLSEEGDQEVLQSFNDAYQPVLDGMLDTLAELGIEYDAFTKESKFVVDGSVGLIMEQLEASELHGTADNGAHYLELESKGIKGKSTKFFFRRGDGSSLYATRDVAYHQWKWQQCDRLINVLGEDHKLQSRQVGIALEEVGQRVPEVVFYAFIKLPDGKMSTRRGNVVFMDDLLVEARAHALLAVEELRADELSQEKMEEIAEAVASSAVRFNIIHVAPGKGFTFRWEDALSFEGDSAPFLMYSHTRACAIQRKVTREGHDVEALIEEAKSQEVWNQVGDSKSANELLRLLGRHLDVLENAVENHRPHLFASHLLALASAFNGFYRDHPVIFEGKVNLLNLLLSETSRRHLASGCQGLGVIPIEEM